jgi:hypothetical protein
MLRELQKAPTGITLLDLEGICSTPGIPLGVFFCHHLLMFTGDLLNRNQCNCFL